MNYAVRPATPTPIICRKDNQGHLVVYLLDTLHHEEGGSVEKWTVGDRLDTKRVSLADYHVSKGLEDLEEQIVADQFVDTWGARNGIVVRRRLYKQSPHHAAQQKSANTSLVTKGKEPAKEAGEGRDEGIENASKEKEAAKNEAINRFEDALKSAQRLYTQEEVDNIVNQKVAETKQEIADKLIVSVTKAMLHTLWQ